MASFARAAVKPIMARRPFKSSAGLHSNTYNVHPVVKLKLLRKLHANRVLSLVAQGRVKSGQCLSRLNVLKGAC